MKVDSARLDAGLLSTPPIADEPVYAVIDSPGIRGQYSTFEFVLRLSQPVHERLAALPSGIVTNSQVGFEGAEAFSVYLHETVHWWQHVGSTYGLVLSMTYPAESHANYLGLRRLAEQVGFKKSVRKLAEVLDGAPDPSTPGGLANIIVNNQFDFDAYRRVTFSPAAREAVVRSPMFESMGHAIKVTYGNVVHLLSSVADPGYQVLPDPDGWHGAVSALRTSEHAGFYFGSPVHVYPIGSLHVMEGQARFAQIQYLHFASGSTLQWDDFRSIGMLAGIYRSAFDLFLTHAGLEWPERIDDPVVGLFLLVCDMAINPGAGFPFTVKFPEAWIEDVDPGARFVFLASAVRTFCPEVAQRIRNYSFDEYEEVSETLSAALKIDSPLSIARTVSSWPSSCEGFSKLMGEWETFDYEFGNLPVRVMLSHFVAFMADKAQRPEFFCWPGAWMVGDRVSAKEAALFDNHSALFVDKPGDRGVFPRLDAKRNEASIQTTFQVFFSSVATYDLTRQWITESGPFHYRFGWLVENAGHEELKAFASSGFESAYGVSPDQFEILDPL